MKAYFDYAATTPADNEVVEEMTSYFSEKFGNSASLHSWGREASKALEISRETIADALNVNPHEIVFTSSATESNNLALKGVAMAHKNKGKHIIISAIEHDCVMESANFLKKEGFEITKVGIDKEGIVNPEEVRKAIRKDTILVSVMHANNEIGTIQPIEGIAKICKEKKVLFHTDAAQTFGKIRIRMDNIDLLTASSHKMYGPKGAAFLFVKEGTKLIPLLHGGGHEFNLRSSTVNVPAIVGFAKAVKMCMKEIDKENERLSKLRDRIISEITSKVSNSFLNGHATKRLPNNVSIRFSRVEGESILMRLDNQGIAVSTGSACSSPKLEPSHVLMALGISAAEAHGSIRISLGRYTKEEEVDYLLEKLPKIIEDLRKISPMK